MKYTNFPKLLAVTTALLLITQTAAYGQPADVRRLTLTEAVHLALAQNRALKIARLKVTETSTKNPASAPLTSLQSPINRTPFM